MKYSSQNKTFSFIDSQINPAVARKGNTANCAEKEVNKNIGQQSCNFLFKKKENS